MGLFDWFGSRKSLEDAVRSNAVRAAIQRGITQDELNASIGPA
jgi:hypothetical protein